MPLSFICTITKQLKGGQRVKMISGGVSEEVIVVRVRGGALQRARLHCTQSLAE